MKSHAVILFLLTSVLNAQEPPQKGETPHPGLLLKSNNVEEPLRTRSYALGFFSQGYKADDGRRLQRTALDLISLALKTNSTPATREDSLTIHGDTSVLIARASEAQHAIIADVIRILKGNMPDAPSVPPVSTSSKSIVRIFALSSIFGSADSGDETHQKERAAKTDALISQIRTSMAMARLDESLPELSFHGSSNSLIAKGTVAQMELITQAISAWRENTPDFRPIRAQ